ncbi:MAG: hypothetical protein HYY67_07560 [Thaumarchaeota archaeon]|nr:hypothetical protein [Nitrososphaerota archaeon]
MARNLRKIHKTIRADPEALDIIEKEADSRGLSFNAFLSSILKRYTEWGKLTERGFVTISQTTYKSLLDELDDETLKRVAERLADRVVREILLVLSGGDDLQSFLRTLEIFSRNSGLFNCDIKVDGERVRISARHELGRNHSLFLMFVWRRFLKSILGVTPEIVIDRNIILVSFNTPEPTVRKLEAPLSESFERIGLSVSLSK